MKRNWRRLAALGPIGVTCRVSKRPNGNVYVVITVPGSGKWDFLRKVHMEKSR